MSQRLIGKSRARRALGADNTPDALAGNHATIDEDLTIKGLVAHGLAALAVSALGLMVAGSVSLTASAQAAESPRTSASVQGAPDQSRAEPAEEAKKAAEEQAAAHEQRSKREQAAMGDLDSFGRAGESTSRNAVRSEIDKAVADQRAKARGSSLEQTGEKATDASGAALGTARNTNLTNAAAAKKREEARLAEEKRKAEEALRNREAKGGTLQAPPPGANPQGAPAEAPQVGAQSAEGMSGSAATPVPSGIMGARWGAVGAWSRYHTGQDISAGVGTPIRAAADGVVMPANGGGWAGIHVVIRHSDGSTLYAHMSGATVSPGQQVRAGQVIGSVGMTGRTFGPHLHFEFYPLGASTSNPYATSDPMAWLARRGVR